MINFHAIAYAPVVLFRPRLLIPDVTVRRLADIDLAALAARGATGMLVDYDDTLASSQSGDLFDDSASFIDRCSDIWGDRVKVFSDSAGSRHGSGGKAADTIRAKLGVDAVIHSADKPFGFDAVSAAFGGSTEGLVVVGDRLLTDIVFGNRYGFRTVWIRHDHPTAPFSRFERLLAGR